MLTHVAAEFVQLVSSEAMEICTKDKKKTIAPDHVLSSLSVREPLPSGRTDAMLQQGADSSPQALGFSEYTGEVKAEFANFKEQSGVRGTAPSPPACFACTGFPPHSFLSHRLLQN